MFSGFYVFLFWSVPVFMEIRENSRYIRVFRVPLRPERSPASS